MGLFNKIKNVLFEEEEIEIPIYTKTKTEPVGDETNTEKTTKLTAGVKKQLTSKSEVKIPIKNHTVEEEKIKRQEYSERETFKTEPTFQFPVFDEQEFNQAPNAKLEKKTSKKQPPVKKEPKKIDFGRFEEKKKVEEDKHFKLSPIISPVYGVLDKNYNRDDFVKKPLVSQDTKTVDVDDIRQKAYGHSLLSEDSIKQEQPTKSISDLLNDVIDEEIEIDGKSKTNPVLSENINYKEKENEDLEVVSDDLKKVPDIQDTLETDLFNLIDSMYTEKEDENL